MTLRERVKAACRLSVPYRAYEDTMRERFQAEARAERAEAENAILSQDCEALRVERDDLLTRVEAAETKVRVLCSNAAAELAADGKVSGNEIDGVAEIAAASADPLDYLARLRSGPVVYETAEDRR
jgi:hypothetical protein